MNIWTKCDDGSFCSEISDLSNCKSPAKGQFPLPERPETFVSLSWFTPIKDGENEIVCWTAKSPVRMTIFND